MVKIDEENNDPSFKRANKCTKGDIIGEHSTSSWQDLPEAPTEEIMERLQFADYLRFGAVCQAWHSKQKTYRLFFWPLQPPMSPPLPWLVPAIYKPSNETVECYSVIEKQMYHLSPMTEPSKTMKVLASSFGWLLLLEGMSDEIVSSKAQLLLYNPVTKDRISLPQISHFQYKEVHFAQLSTSPVDSNCVILLVNGDYSYLYRLTDCSSWVRFETRPLETDFSAAVYCNDKFYCKGLMKLYVIDPTFPTPTFRCLDMDFDISPNFIVRGNCGMVESEGELFLYAWVWNMIFTNNQISGYVVKNYFHVFKADIYEQRWIKMQSIGSNRVLFVHGFKGLMLSLGNNSIGLRRNCVYYSSDDHVGDDISWHVYDLETKSSTFEVLSCDNPMKHSAGGEELFLPALSSVRQAKAECT